MKDGDKHTLLEILERLSWLEKAGQRDEEEFLDDHFFQQGVIRDLQIVGEACKELSQAFRDDLPDIDWRAWMRFRDVLVHRYDKRVAPDVWKAVIEDAPGLFQALELAAHQRGWN